MPGRDRPELSVTGLIAGAGATVTATVAASYFGVGGTLIGAGAVSVLSTVGAVFYQHFLDRGKARIAAKIPVRADVPPRPAGTLGRTQPKWFVLAGAACGLFLAVMTLVTAFELATGRPLSSTVQGRSGGGTSVHPVRAGVRPLPMRRGHRHTGAATPTPSERATAPLLATPSAGGTQEPRPTPTAATSAVPPPPSAPPEDADELRTP